MASCFKSTSRSRTTRRSSTARAPTSVLSTARQSSTRTTRRRRSREAYIAQLDKAKIFERPIVTTVTADTGFYAAEDYHQDFLVNNPDNPYIVFNDLPKVQNLEKLFPRVYLRQPVTVYAANARR